jgi:small multidrug resistance pump
MHWIYLAVAIVAEVIATAALKASQGFSLPGPSTLVVVGYGLAFFLLARALTGIPLSVGYAIWSGLGVVASVLIGRFWFGELIGPQTFIGIILTLSGIVLMQTQKGVF